MHRLITVVAHDRVLILAPHGDLLNDERPARKIKSLKPRVDDTRAG